MVPLTRRRLLHGAVGALVGLAGCSDSRDGTSTETASQSPSSDTGAVPDHYSLRRPDEKPAVRVSDERRRGTTASSSPTDGPPEDARQRGFVTSTEAARRMWFADTDGAAEARQFVADTDFDSETLYVEFYPVRECYSLELCSVTWSRTDIHTQYGSYLRSSDVSCEVEARDGVSWLIRIPEVLDPEAMTGGGSGWSSNGCGRRHRPPDQTTTDAPDFGPKPPTNGTETATEGDR
ncbi:hypothetical protein M0R89_20570 (plasmid) [Halorussus limi]|uniref:Lipoprotein n=1 Tax=Halorussus limi TaxID=2938695 RepID=A0A8U0I0G4_9EURY|nr:hypothetical protein [Halorussus limi]UPV76865.1 hypothetical protein M0R89_20570 [Halorussus limi]